MFRILIVDDEDKMTKALGRALSHGTPCESLGGKVSVSTASSAEEAEGLLRKESFDAALVDLRLPGKSGLDLLVQVRKISPETDVVLMTAYATVETAVKALKEGARDYVIKPFGVDEIVHILQTGRERRRLERENQVLRLELAEQKRPKSIVGNAPAFAKAMAMAIKVAPLDSTVLLRGESGTGKDLLAEEIHRMSPRADGPFIKATCAAIPEGLLESDLFGHEKGSFTGATEARKGRFELAEGGTVFLDEVGDMTPATQIKLLRVLQDRQFERVGSHVTRKADVRVLAATNRNLEEALENGRFREDLYYRLAVIAIHLPPLRERMEDLPALAAHFLEAFARRTGTSSRRLSRMALNRLLAYHWPGNVRELQNAMEYACVMAENEVLESEDFPPPIGGSRAPETSGETSENPLVVQSLRGLMDSGLSLDEVEKRLILEALKETGGNQTQAARKLGITRRTLGYRLEKHGIELEKMEEPEEETP